MVRTALVVALMVAAGSMSGCKKSGSAAQGNTQDAAVVANMSAVELYNARRYSDALNKGELEARKTKGREHEVNQLTAGLSAYALNQPSMAQHYLQSLTGSEDPQIAGRAAAVLGQIAESRGNRKLAAEMFKQASEKLDGDDAARAAVRAGNSLSSMGRSAEARKQYQTAVKEAENPAIRQTAAKLGEPGPFTLQVGAFVSRASAEKKVREVTPAAARAGLGTPRIVPDSIAGKPGFSVRVGTFAVRQAAVNAKSRLGGETMVVSAN